MSDWLAAFLMALVAGSLVEYWGHRVMHRWLLKKKHAEHHRDGVGQGWLWEFFDYFWGSVLLMPVGFVYSLEAGIGFLGGAVTYAAFAAYAHQLQHQMPELCFWMARPVHYLHHKNHMWHTNFGISLDIWDRVFGTYRLAEWKPEKKYPMWNLLTIKWI